MAYTLDDSDHIVFLGLKILKDTYHADLLPVLETRKNGRVRFLFNTERMTPMTGVKDELSLRYSCNIISGLAQVMLMIEEQPFWEKEYLDIDMKHVYIDMANGTPGFVLMPVRSDDDYIRNEWVGSFARLCETLSADRSYSDNQELALFREKTEELRRAMKAGNVDLQQEVQLLISYMTEKWAGGAVTEEESEPENDSRKNQRLELHYSGRYGNFGMYVQKSEFVIGKGSGCDGVISFNNAISRKHLKITLNSRGWFAEDLGSTNHSWLDGQLLVAHKPALLREDDTLRIADMDFQVHIEDISSES
jgi:hypothetical protein